MPRRPLSRNQKIAILGIVIPVISGIIFVIFTNHSTVDNSQHNTVSNNCGLTITNSPGAKVNQSVSNCGNTSTTSTNNATDSLDRSELMEMYENNGPYYLKLDYCAVNLVNSTNINSVQLWLYPLMYNGKDYPTSIPFYVYAYFEYYGIQAGSNTGILYAYEENPFPLVDPKPRIQPWTLDLTKPLEKAFQENITKVEINMTYFSFAPFDTTDQKLIAEYPPPKMIRMTLAEFNLVNGNWDMGGNNTICSQSLPLSLKS